METGILAIDFGGTRIRAGWFDSDLNLRGRAETPSQVSDGPQVVVDRIIKMARRVMPVNADLRAVGIAGPGPLDAERGVILHAKTLPGWGELPLVAIMRQVFHGVPIFMHNDANLAAMAEYHRGAGIDCNPMLYMTISTGIGGGAMLNGALFTGWRGLAIEPGHVRFTLPNGTSKRLEELASGTGLAEIARERLATTYAESVLRGVAVVDGAAVGQAAVAGDPFAVGIVTEAGQWLGLGIVSLLHMFNPEAVVLGGSVMKLGDLLLNPARKVIKAHILDAGFYTNDMIRIAHLEDDVCLVGAALYAHQELR